jgi:hypothetical protein
MCCFPCEFFFFSRGNRRCLVPLLFALIFLPRRSPHRFFFLFEFFHPTAPLKAVCNLPTVAVIVVADRVV